MKNLVKSFGLLFLATITLTSCSVDPCGNDKDAFLKNFDTLVDKVEDIDYDTENSKWEGYNEDFKKLVEDCYEIHEDDLTRREEKRFWKKTTLYYVKTFSGQVNFEEQAAEFGKLLDDNIEGISEEIGQAVKDIDLDININEEELEELFEELGDDIEKMGKKWGRKLEKILEKE